jgi:hypothetical protein
MSNDSLSPFYSSSTLFLAALQQQQIQNNEAHDRAVAALKQKKQRNEVLAAVTLVAAPSSAPNLKKRHTTGNRTVCSGYLHSKSRAIIMEDVLRGGPIPTKLNNLRFTNDSATNSTCSDSEQNPAMEEPSHKQRLLESGLLAATDEYPLQFLASYSPDPVTDVIVGLHLPPWQQKVNVQFHQMCVSSVPVFQAAIAARGGEIVKKLVKAILKAVSDNGGHFVTPIENHGQRWSEVCRNVAERFTLQELRKQSAAQKEQAVASGQIIAAITEAQRQASAYSGAHMAQLRRVSPPLLAFPPESACNEQKSSHFTERGKDEESFRDDAMNSKDKRPKKHPKLSSPSDDALYILSEAAAKVASLKR